MGLICTVEPAELAVSLADAKKQCEVSESDTTHDEHLTRLIRAATDDVERFTRRALITQTWRLSLREWPHDALRQWPHPGRLLIPRPPLQSITSIVYTDDNGSLITLDSSLYQVSTDASPSFAEPAYGEVWPTLRPETLEAVRITYVAGFGDLDTDVPDQYKNAIYELVAFRFMNRGDVDVDIPKHIKWALNALRCGAMYDYYGVKG